MPWLQHVTTGAILCRQTDLRLKPEVADHIQADQQATIERGTRFLIGGLGAGPYLQGYLFEATEKVLVKGPALLERVPTLEALKEERRFEKLRGENAHLLRAFLWVAGLSLAMALTFISILSISQDLAPSSRTALGFASAISLFSFLAGAAMADVTDETTKAFTMAEPSARNLSGIFPQILTKLAKEEATG